MQTNLRDPYGPLRIDALPFSPGETQAPYVSASSKLINQHHGDI